MNKTMIAVLVVCAACGGPESMMPCDGGGGYHDAEVPLVASIGDVALLAVEPDLRRELGDRTVLQTGSVFAAKAVDCGAKFEASHVGVDVVVWACTSNSLLTGASGANTWRETEPALTRIISSGARLVVSSTMPDNDYDTALAAWCVAPDCSIVATHPDRTEWAKALAAAVRVHVQRSATP